MGAGEVVEGGAGLVSLSEAESPAVKEFLSGKGARVAAGLVERRG